MRNPKPAIRLVIADDHGIVRDGLRKLFELEADFEVLAMASNGHEAVALAERLLPDVLLLDVSMPGLDGFGVLTSLSTRRLPVKCLLLTAELTREATAQAMTLGARGVVTKDAPSALLFKAIRAVMAGEYWVSRDVMGLLMAKIASGSAPTPSPRVNRIRLTKRELEITQLVVAGYSNPEIAARCSLSPDTVKHHVSNVFDKTGVSSRVELVRFADNDGLIGPDQTPS